MQEYFCRSVRPEVLRPEVSAAIAREKGGVQKLVVPFDKTFRHGWIEMALDHLWIAVTRWLVALRLQAIGRLNGSVTNNSIIRQLFLPTLPTYVRFTCYTAKTLPPLFA